MTNYLEASKQLAASAHAGQFRRDGVTPYISHPAAVAESVQGDDAKALAWLHDVIEDTDTTWEEVLETGVPPAVVEALRLLTKMEGTEYQSYILPICRMTSRVG